MDLKLKLTEIDSKNTIQIKQKERIPKIDDVELSERKIVYENKWYEIVFSLNDIKIDSIKKIDCFLNDDFIGSALSKNVSNDCSEGRIVFFDDNQKKVKENTLSEPVRKVSFKAQLFLLQYDLVFLSTVITFNDGSHKTFYGDYILCVSNNYSERENISNILKELNLFDFSPINKLLFNDNSTFKSLSSYIQLVKNIVVCYQEELHYFTSMNKQSIQSSKVLESFNKVRKVSNNSITWLMQNSNMLSEVNEELGLKYNGKYYLPLKIQTENNIERLDVYEKQIALGFLYIVHEKTKQVLNDLQLEYKTTEGIIKKVQQSISKQYSAPIITLKAIQVEFSRQSINVLQNKLNQLEALYRQYSIILKVKKLDFKTSPKNTKTFQEKISYFKIFQTITSWFNYGEFDFAKEKLILRVKTPDKLFEYFCLYRLLILFDNEKFKALKNQKATRSFIYEEGEKSYPNEIDIPNTYYLERDGIKVTLYYQPVIKTNGFFNDLSLYRITNSILGYSIPNFVIKFNDTKGQEEYIILDSKFSSINNIKEFQMNEIISKYSTQLAVAKEISVPRMVWILQGRVDNTEKKIWYYNSSPNAKKYKPATSYGVLSINTKADVETSFWNEIKENIECIEW